MYREKKALNLMLPAGTKGQIHTQGREKNSCMERMEGLVSIPFFPGNSPVEASSISCSYPNSCYIHLPEPCVTVPLNNLGWVPTAFRIGPFKSLNLLFETSPFLPLQKPEPHPFTAPQYAVSILISQLWFLSLIHSISCSIPPPLSWSQSSPFFKADSRLSFL